MIQLESYETKEIAGGGECICAKPAGLCMFSTLLHRDYFYYLKATGDWEFRCGGTKTYSRESKCKKRCCKRSFRKYGNMKYLWDGIPRRCPYSL